MSRLPRPYIPLSVRVQVAERQCRESGWIFPALEKQGKSKWLREMLGVLFGEQKAELHHRPALVNRRKVMRGDKIADYEPPANDPEHLVYLVESDHDVETRVRGQHGAHSDLGLNRKNKRIAKNRDPNRRKAKIPQRRDPWGKGRKMRPKTGGFRR